MVPEETLLEPPVTPAHVFAYRALRGWFAGSPHSPDDNKENHSPVPIKTGSRKSDEVLQLSPQKRKRDSLAISIPLSPTKSILRTPGAATPRAKSLRDVNVKFKSASPDVSRKEPKTGANSVEWGVKAATQAAAGNSDHKASTAKQVPAMMAVKPQPAVFDPATASASASDADLLEDQNRTAAKEMKRLIRYGTKWRTFARQKNEENARLRVLLEDTQRENRRLEAALRMIEDEPKVDVGNEDRSGAIRAASTAQQRSSSARTSKVACDQLSSAADPQSIPKPPMDASTMPACALPRRTLSDSVPCQSPLTALQHRIEGSILPNSDIPRMDPARLAATRKRLLAKTQARRAGAMNS